MLISRGIAHMRKTVPTIARALTSISRPDSDVSGTGGFAYVDSRNCAMGVKSIIYFLTGMCYIAGTVYLFLVPKVYSPGTSPLGSLELEEFFKRQRSALKWCFEIGEIEKGKKVGQI